MRTVFTDLNIQTTVQGIRYQALNIVLERFLRSIPNHCHGNNSYELHYISRGYGRLYIGEQLYPITPNTFFVTGPHVEHEQIPDLENPMEEYCIYFKIQRQAKTPRDRGDRLSLAFEQTLFWFGQDTQELLPVMKQIFFELEHKYTGYVIQVESLLQQCIVKAVRNYEKKQPSKTHFAPSNLMDQKYLVVEELFLYEFETLTLESLSRRLGLSPRQTERFLKENYGKTFTRKKAEAKMSMAKIYLNNKEMSISEIADSLNYSTIQHFSTAFKKFYGITPSEYRVTVQPLR